MKRFLIVLLIIATLILLGYLGFSQISAANHLPQENIVNIYFDTSL